MRFLLFVYGTLKKNESNNEYFLGDQEFVGKAVTRPLYRLYDNGRFPMLKEDSLNGMAIQGEIWSVTEDAMYQMDRLEGHPYMYERKPVEIEGRTDLVQGYIYQQPVHHYVDCSPVWRRRTKEEDV